MAANRDKQPITKLPRVPKGSRIQKRPILKRPQPKSSKTRLIYVSSKTPFMALVTRIRKRLDKSLKERPPPAPSASYKARIQGLDQTGGETESPGMSVVVMGAGKAIEKTLSLASFYSEQNDCTVDVRTKTVATVDDVVREDVEDESRIRRMSALEVTIRLR